MHKFELGDKLRDTVSGLEGVAVARTEYMNGCTQYQVLPKMKKGTTEMPSWHIDEEQLELVKSKTKIRKKKPTGGPTVKAHEMRVL